MSVYDVFLFHNEIKLLQFRAKLLDPYVDYFVVGQGFTTFQGNPRGLVDIQKILSGIVHPDKIISTFIHTDVSGSGDYAASQRETMQRDLLTLELYEAQPDDLILFGDADEIPNPEILQTAQELTAFGPYKLEQYLSYYRVTYRANYFWYGTTVARRRDFRSLVELRNRTIDNTPIIDNGGWHFSYLGDATFIKQKLLSFSHTDMIRQYITDDNIEKALLTGSNLFGRNETFITVPIDGTFPPNIEDLL